MREPQKNTAGEKLKLPEAGIGLCLSGGGYRAMMFHTGVLWRLLELGLLKNIDRISSVSGGSITAARLGLHWDKYFNTAGKPDLVQFEQIFVDKIRIMASQTIDARWASLGGLLNPWSSISKQIAKAYKKYLFHDKTLQSLPDRPRFIINASNLQSGALWRFSKPYLRDWKVGEIKNPQDQLASVVAASSAFPPVLSPAVFKYKLAQFTKNSGGKPLNDQFKTKVCLTDGGVYDNLGMEAVFKRYDTVLVSDAGMEFAEKPKVAFNWPFQLKRVLDCIDNQVRSLRVRELIKAYKMRLLFLNDGHNANDWFVRENSRTGAYWNIDTPIQNYRLTNGTQVKGLLAVKPASTEELAHISTRLAKMDDETQERLINWGYAACDAAIRTYYDSRLTAPKKFPYKRGCD